MKFKPFKAVGYVAKTFVNARGWLSYDQHKQTTLRLFNTLRGIYQPTQPEQSESFEAAVARLQLSEHALRTKIKNFETQAIIYAGVGIIVTLYALYLLFGLHVLPALLSLIMATFLGLRWSQMRFWVYQIRHHRLGCTWQEWWFSHKRKKS